MPVICNGQDIFPSRDTPVGSDAWRQFWEDAVNAKYPKHDPNFIQGKNVYLGLKGHKKYNFCLAQNADDQAVELNRKNLRDYRRMEVTAFIKSLYDCDDPGKLVLAKLDKKDAGLVVYYLHRQYKLRLRQPKLDKTVDKQSGKKSGDNVADQTTIQLEQSAQSAESVQ